MVAPLVALTATQAVLGTLGSIGKYSADRRHRQAQLDIARRESERAKGELREQLGRDERSIINRTRRTVGKQRTVQASQGIDLSYGTATQLLEQELDFGLDELEVVKLNAYRRAYGIDLDTLEVANAARRADLEGRGKIVNTALSGVLSTIFAGTNVGSELTGELVASGTVEGVKNA